MNFDFSSFGKIVECSVYRKEADATDEDYDIHVACIRSLLGNRYATEVQPDYTRLCGYNIATALEDGLQVVDQVNNSDILFYEQPPQAELRVSNTVALHSAVYRGLENKL